MMHMGVFVIFLLYINSYFQDRIVIKLSVIFHLYFNTFRFICSHIKNCSLINWEIEINSQEDVLLVIFRMIMVKNWVKSKNKYLTYFHQFVIYISECTWKPVYIRLIKLGLDLNYPNEIHRVSFQEHILYLTHIYWYKKLTYFSL